MSDSSNAPARPATDDSVPDPQELHRLARRGMRRVLEAVEKAGQRLERAAAEGESVFTTDADARIALGLARLLPSLMRYLPPLPRPPVIHGPIPRIPRCDRCGAGPGAHWTSECPTSVPQA